MADLSTARLPPLFTREQARAAGLTDRQLDRCLAKGDLVAERHGVLRQPDNPATTPQAAPNAGAGPIFRPPAPLEPLPVDIRAALLASPGRSLVISHASAARLWALPSPVGGWPQPQFTAASGSGRRRRGLNVRVAALADDDLMDKNGVLATTPVRTVADCLRSLRGRDSLAVIDAALHRGLVTNSAVLDVLHRQAGWPGVRLARQVLGLADGRRESPLESWSAWAFAHTDVPTPDWQVGIRGPDGVVLGRVDCWWSEGVIGETDGRAKYALATAERGGSADALLDVLQAERRREQRLREVGGEVLRWGAGDVLNEAKAWDLGRRLCAAIALAQSENRFTGVVEPTMPPPSAR